MEYLINIPEKECYVLIYRNAISTDLCERLLNVLKVDCIHRYPNKVFGRITEQPRCNCLYADDDITQMDYSNSAVPSMKWNSEMLELKRLISSDNFNPNSCLVNGYITNIDMVGAHKDKNLLDGNNTVCTVSLGGTRLFRFKQCDTKDVIETYLNQGDVVYMYGKTNEYFTHEIPKYRKTIDKYEFKPRYSCTFRTIKQGVKPICYTIEDMMKI